MAARKLIRPQYLHVLFFLMGIFVARLPGTIAQVTGQYDFWNPLIEIQAMIDHDYVEKPDLDAMQKGAIDGMLQALDDPYTEYIPPAEQKDFEKAMTGEFVGIGAEVRKDPGPTLVDGKLVDGGYLRIVSPLEDSPAYKAGIMAGDQITHVGDKSTLDLSIDDCIKLLTGEPGTSVTVVVKRDGVTLDPIVITRRHITVRAVRGLYRDEKSGHYDYIIDPARRIAYIRLTQFTPTAGDELEQAINEASESGTLGGLILDLRGNPGGVLDAALQIADMFLNHGVIVSVRGRTGNDQVFKAKKPGTLADFPLVLLVDGQSASASEIVSGALKEDDRAVIVGTRTFGKGLVQTVRPVPHTNGGQIKFTAQRYYLPSGRLIQRTDESVDWGVDPTDGFYVPLTDQQQLDRILKRRALDIIHTNGAPDHEDAKPDEDSSEAAPSDAPADEQPAESDDTAADGTPGDAQQAAEQPIDPSTIDFADPKQLDEKLADPQLAAALTAVQGRVDNGKWTPVSDKKAQHGKIAVSELHRLERARDRMIQDFGRLDRRIQALNDEAAGLPEAKQKDLWPDNVSVADGHMDVYDKNGKLVARLKITGADLERWLIDADVKPVADSAAADSGEKAKSGEDSAVKPAAGDGSGG